VGPNRSVGSGAQAYIADNTTPQNRARSFALIGIAFGLGFMVGPALGGYLSHYGMGVPLYLAAGHVAGGVCAASLLASRWGSGAFQPGEAPGVLA
jgi:MFS family permease